MKLSRKTITLAGFAVSLAVFSLARARIVSLSASGPDQARLLTGAEPAYLLLAHSVVRDRDFNLYNNRVERDGRRFGMERCDEHGARKDWERKEIYSIHTPGLPLLIAPAYAVGLIGPLSPRAAVCLFLNLIAALLAANVGRKTLLTARGLGIALAARNYQGRLTHSCPPQTVSPARLCSICALLAGLTAVGVM